MGRVIAVDGSPSMIEKAKENLPGERVEFICQNLVELQLCQTVDHVFSNATFHWIADHEALFSRIHEAVKPGGMLVAQCGGRGNVAEIVGALEPANCWLEEQVARPEEPQAFIEAASLAPIRELLSTELFQPFSDRMMSVMGQPEIFNYVRLNIVARRERSTLSKQETNA